MIGIPSDKPTKLNEFNIDQAKSSVADGRLEFAERWLIDGTRVSVVVGNGPKIER